MLCLLLFLIPYSTNIAVYFNLLKVHINTIRGDMVHELLWQVPISAVLGYGD